MNRNVAAQALVLLVPLAARAALAAPGLPERALGTAAAALGAALLVATRSRAAMVAAVAGGALAAVLAAIARRRAAERPARPAARRSRFAVALGAAVAAGAAAGALVPGAGASRLPSVTRSFALLAQGGGRSGEVRAALHANAMLLVARHPLIGAGPGRFPVVYPEVNRAVRETPDFGEAHVPESAHHDALQYAVELGVPAAWCLLAALGLGLAGLARRALLGPGRGNALAAAALAGALLHSLASFPLHSPASAWLAWFLAGRGWAAFVRPGAAGGSRWRARRAAALVLALLAFPLAWRDARAQAALARGWAAHGRGDCRAALREARAVVRSSLRHRDLVLAGQIAFDCERDPARSLALLERALAANPDQPNLLLATGARRLKAGRPEGARELFLRATAILPGSPRSWLGLAMAESRLGRTSEARRACERALSLPEALPAAEAFCRPLVGRGGTGSVSGGGTPPREPRAGPPACR
ncbi:MAG: hypothetical protein D6718_13505 [Acidobacteria bacterium]|nr:MAG: hypothetical protein D6718_13505 [Acidobacteriota bacterium]